MHRFPRSPAMFFIAGLFAGLLDQSAAYATSNVSAKHDGVYAGTGHPVPGMSAPSCPAIIIGPVTIANGFLQSEKIQDRPRITGFITEEGYISGKFVRGGANPTSIDGRLVEGGLISAGVIEDDTGCAWTFRLRRTP